MLLITGEALDVDKTTREHLALSFPGQSMP